MANVKAYHAGDEHEIEKFIAGQPYMPSSYHSNNWLGNGLYFWENNPNKAEKWQIEKGKGAKYKDEKLFQRRAIVKLKDNITAVIESYENISLSSFTSDMLELGVIDALYTDMGAWDEGWYRNPSDKKIITIGRMKTQTDKQCNWVVFKIN